MSYMRTFLLIDSENFKKKIESVFRDAGRPKRDFGKYNFRKLLDGAIKDISIERALFYISRVKMDVRTPDKSRELIENQRLLKSSLLRQRFEVVVAGQVRGHEENMDSKNVLVFKEKGVDVKIAVDMVRFACDKLVDQIIIASSDSDLQPAIEEAKKRGVKLIYLGFETQQNKGLMYTTGRTILLRNNEVLQS